MTKAGTLTDIRQEVASLLLPPEASAVPIFLVDADEEALAKLGERERNWIAARGWTPKRGSVLALPGVDGGVASVLLGVGKAGWEKDVPLLPGTCPGSLPPGDYRFADKLPDPELAAYAWLAGSYRFRRYKGDQEEKPRRLVLPERASRDAVLNLAEAVCFGRDLINMPANDFGPAELEAAARELADAHGASIKITEGSGLLAANFPMIHAVGRASDRAPRLIDLTWGSERAPKLTLVGKGICFDTGGLDIKPASGMALMKKDMGGAAAALACAHLIMQSELPVRLRLLIPAADNSIAGNAFRPGDVLLSRSGMTVEIGNTDAEGRLVLADAISLADEEAPDYLITLATLTGAARVALGPDLPPLYATDDDLAHGLLASGTAVGDPLWRMPLWAPYDKLLKSSIADMNHIAEGSYAGSIIAALFLQRFVKAAKRFAHLDIFAWVPSAQPGRPQGAEPQAARALFHYFANELSS